jgi:hypothetical protein
MALSANSPRAVVWSALVEPDEQIVHESQYMATSSAAELTECGLTWDAVVVAPLQRGLLALDALAVPVDAGLPVLADFTRYELVVLVEPGTGRAVAGLPGVRVLSQGSWLLVPTRGQGELAAVWLSGPGEAGYVEASALREALLRVDVERVEQGRAQMCEALGVSAPSAP